MKNQRETGKKETTKSDFGRKQFLVYVMLIDSSILVSIALPLYVLMPVEYAVSVVVSTLLTTINTLVGFHYTNKYINAPAEEFVSYVYGSMFFRMVALGGAIFALLLFTNFPQISFILSLFISYLSKSVLEIIFINKRSTQRHEKS